MALDLWQLAVSIISGLAVILTSVVLWVARREIRRIDRLEKQMEDKATKASVETQRSEVLEAVARVHTRLDDIWKLLARTNEK